MLNRVFVVTYKWTQKIVNHSNLSKTRRHCLFKTNSWLAGFRIMRTFEPVPIELSTESLLLLLFHNYTTASSYRWLVTLTRASWFCSLLVFGLCKSFWLCSKWTPTPDIRTECRCILEQVDNGTCGGMEKCKVAIFLLRPGMAQRWEGTNTGLDYWNGLLDWNTGLTYFWFLHILWLVKLIFHWLRGH